MKYLSGEEIKQGDNILIDGVPGVIELVTSDLDDWEQAWYLETCGPGVMISEPKIYGHLFTGCDDEDLKFVGRA